MEYVKKTLMTEMVNIEREKKTESKEKSKLLKRVQLEKGGIRDSEDKQELIRINLKIKCPGTKI